MKKAKKFNMLQLRIIVFVLTLVIFSAQGKAESHFGIKIGSAISNFYYTSTNSDPNSDLEIDLSPYLGYDIKWVQTAPQKALFTPYISIYYEKKLTDKFGLRPEISFVRKGLSFNQYKYERIIYQVEISYLEIPLSLVYKLFQGKRAISEIYFGGYGAFKVDSVKKVAYHDSPIEKIKINSVNNFDWGIHLGAGYKRRFFKKKLIFDIRLFLGFIDIFSFPDNGTQKYFSTQKTKITGAYLTLGYEL